MLQTCSTRVAAKISGKGSESHQLSFTQAGNLIKTMADVKHTRILSLIRGLTWFRMCITTMLNWILTSFEGVHSHRDIFVSHIFTSVGINAIILCSDCEAWIQFVFHSTQCLNWSSLTLHIITNMFWNAKMRQMWWSFYNPSPVLVLCIPIIYHFRPRICDEVFSCSYYDLEQLMVSYFHDLISQFYVPLLIHLGSRAPIIQVVKCFACPASIAIKTFIWSAWK